MEKVTDLTFLQGFAGGNADKMKKYISMFLQLCPASLDKMKNALDASDYDGLRAAAHALKPQISYMGIKGGEPLVKDIEHLAGTKTETEKLPQLLADFDGLCRIAMEELKAAIA
ncbi:MAG: hypothetical protein RL021_1859 [Bacteroidota bacterium]|jgi:HPt (histidine-containing phosphotransfer) domain-containing protein